MNAEVFLKATKVDGVYDCDPVKHPEKAKRYDKLTYRQVSLENLQVGGAVKRKAKLAGNIRSSRGDLWSAAGFGWENHLRVFQVYSSGQ
jgi:isopentenyl phosphate kinase